MTRFRDQFIRLVDDALGDDPRAALRAARRLPGEIEWLSNKAVALARVSGYDWGRIGRLLGITRQAARQRFGVIVPKPSPLTVEITRYHRPYQEAERMAERFAAGLPIIEREPDDPVFW